MSLENGTLRSPSGDYLFFHVSMEQKSPAVLYFSKGELAFKERLMGIVNQVTISTTFFVWGVGGLGVNYLIRSLIGFFKLPILYIFLPIPALLPPLKESLFSLFGTMTEEGI